MVAKWDFNAEVATQLAFKAGDIINVILQDVGAPGWWHGRLGEKEGLIPNNYVMVVEILKKKKKILRINQKKVSSKIKELRNRLAVRSSSFANMLIEDVEKPEAPPNPKKPESAIIATVARRKKLQSPTKRETIISFFDGSEESITSIDSAKSENNDVKEREQPELIKTTVVGSDDVSSEDGETELGSHDESTEESTEESGESDEREIGKEEQERISTVETENETEDTTSIQPDIVPENEGSKLPESIPVPIDISKPVTQDQRRTSTPSNTSPQSTTPPITLSPNVSIDEEAQIAVPRNIMWRCFERCSLL